MHQVTEGAMVSEPAHTEEPLRLNSNPADRLGEHFKKIAL